MQPLTREQIRKIDSYAINNMGISGLVLMENAGRNVADAIEGHMMLYRYDTAKIAIVIGSGNNGGDGFVIARHLTMRGFYVEAFVVVPKEKITGDAAVNMEIANQFQLPIHFVNDKLYDFSAELSGFDAIVDAIGGTGITGVLAGPQASAVEAVNNHAGKAKIFAVDIPTGLDCDKGISQGPAIRADLTVTFVAKKKGFSEPGAKKHTGDVMVADIGIDADIVTAMIEQNGE